MLNLRAMLSEMDITHPQDGFDIRILVEIKRTRGALVSKTIQDKILSPMLPREFWRLCEFWSEDLEKALLPNIAPGILEG